MNNEIIQFGKYKGQNIIDISIKDIDYILYCINKGLIIFDGCGDLVKGVYNRIELKERAAWFLKHRGNTLKLRTPVYLRLKLILEKEMKKNNKSKVYFIKDESNRYKIGKGNEPKMRLGELQVGNSEELSLMLEIPGSFELEGLIHNILKKYKIRGEWYRDCELLHTILNILGGE